MTAETLKPFISSPSSENFSPEDPSAGKRQSWNSLITIGLNVTCVGFVIAVLAFMVWSTVRVAQLEAEVKSVTRLVDSMKRKLGLDYLDDLSDLDYPNGFLDDARSPDNDNSSLLSSVGYDDADDEDDFLGGSNDNYDDDHSIEGNEPEKENSEGDISSAYPDDSEADSYENDDNLYDDFEKYKDAKKLSRKTRSIDSAPNDLSAYTETIIQRKNTSSNAGEEKSKERHLFQRNKSPTIRPLEDLLLKNSKEISNKRQVSGKLNENKSRHLSRQQYRNLSKMRLHDRKIRAMLKSGPKTGSVLASPISSHIIAGHYHLNSSISGRHVLHPTHSTLPHDGDVYIGASYSWAKNLGIDKFTHTNYGALIIQENGLYLIYAQIYYDNRYDRNGYVVYHNVHPFLICSAFIPTNINKSHTCYTSGLIYLKQNDEIHIRDIHRDRAVSLIKGKSFFGLVKIDNCLSIECK